MLFVIPAILYTNLNVSNALIGETMPFRLEKQNEFIELVIIDLIKIIT